MNGTLDGPRILAALKASGIEVAVSVPDVVRSRNTSGRAVANTGHERRSPWRPRSVEQVAQKRREAVDGLPVEIARPLGLALMLAFELTSPPFRGEIE